ncbi:MAG: TlpA family protein disulfide reductase [Bryobacteraceae bacterium]
MEPNLTDNWVDRRLATLETGDGWSPDPALGLQRCRHAAAARKRRAKTWAFAASGATAACACLLAFPATRVFAQRCVNACVAETAAVGQFFGFTTPRPADARRAAPDFSLTDASGNAVRLAGFKGKVVLLNFWATWCPPCKTEIPWFVEFQRAYGDAGLVVLGVSMDENGWESVRPSLETMPVNYRIMVGNDEIARQFGGVETLPTTFLIDRAGRIAVSHAGLADRTAMAERIEALLAER